MLSSAIFGYLFIFFARIVDMSMDTIRVILIVKGRRAVGAILGFFQILVWLTVISVIFKHLDNIGNMIAYAAGFAAGNYIGSLIEEVIALGTVSVQVILPKCDDKVVNTIREAGFGVSVVECIGKEGPKTLLIIQTQRKQIKRLKCVINGIDPTAFVTILETKTTVNGYFESCKNT